MNLLELSMAIGTSPDVLKAEIEEKFQIIILSNNAQLRANVVNTLLQAGKEKPDKPAPAGKTADSTELVLLQKLEQTLVPELAYTRRLLDYCIGQKFLFFIDLCSLLHDQFYAFYDLFKEAAQPTGTKLIVPYVVTEEMKRMLLKRNKEPDVLKRCEKVMEFLLQENNSGLIEFVGSEDDKRTNREGKKIVHADSLLLEKILYFHNDAKDVLLITQDHGFSMDALYLNHMKSTVAHAVVLAKKITNKGALVDNAEDAGCPPLPIDTL